MRRNIVHLEDGVVCKRFFDQRGLCSEIGIRKTLAGPWVEKFAPKLLDAALGEQNTATFEFIPGAALTGETITPTIAYQLGAHLGLLHRHHRGQWAGCGRLGREGTLEAPCRTYPIFIQDKLNTWLSRGGVRLERNRDKVLATLKRLGEHEILFQLGLRSTFVTCHGDIQWANIVAGPDEIRAFIDWEYAGAYPVEWELRKISPLLFWHDKQLGLEFAKGYAVSGVTLDLVPDIVNLTIALDAIGSLSRCDQHREDSMVIETLLADAVARF